MNLELLKQNWEAFGAQDPLWAILSDPSRRGGRWELDEFLQTGEDEIAGVVADLVATGIAVPTGRALDFGCGVGRLTQALAARFHRCDGVDIATSMITEARRINRFGDRVRYHVNAEPDLSLFAGQSFDLVLSFIVLQHMEPGYAARYLSEFIRVLKVGGIAVFQLPTRNRVPSAPLAPDAFRATLTVVSEPPQTLSAGEATPIQVRVRNDSLIAWPAASLLTIGGRWYTGKGQFVGEHDARALLPATVGAGEQLVVETGVRAPGTVGDYRLELDLVHDTGGWFSQHGSLPLVVSIGVTAPRRRQPSGGTQTAGRQPVMEMHGMQPRQVKATLEAAGAELIAQIEDTRGGPLVEGYRYIARRVTDTEPAAMYPALAALDAAIAAIPDRADMFPPVLSRRSGAAATLERRVRRGLGRALRSLTWVQAEHNHAVRRALYEIRIAVAEQETELRRLRRELARERDGKGSG